MVAGRLKRWLGGLSCVVVTTAVLCCTASIKPQGPTEKEVLTKRATEYWVYKIRGDLDKCYGYEIPSYREKVNIVDYIRSQGQVLRLTDAEVKRIEVDEGRGRVEVLVKFRYQIPNFKIKEGGDYVKEDWAKVSGEWYHLPSGFVYH